MSQRRSGGSDRARIALAVCVMTATSACRLSSDSPPAGDGAPIDAATADAAGDADVSDWHDPTYPSRKRITLTPPQSLAVPSISNLPIAVVTNNDPDLAAAAEADGIDLMFALVGGEAVPHEIETFNRINGSLVAWVRLPELSLESDTPMYMYFGRTGTAGLGDPEMVWAAPFFGTWHFSQDPTNLPPQMLDSSAGHHGTTGGAATPTSVAGIIGDALEFDGVDDTVTVEHPLDGSLDVSTESITYSVWVNVPEFAGQFDMPFYKGGADESIPGFDMQLGSGFWIAKIADGTIDVSGGFGASDQYLGRWVNLVAVIDREDGELRTYVDGAAAETTSLGGLGSLANTRRIQFSRDVDPFLGTVDEFRLYRGVMSPTAIAVAYANITQNAAFLTFGSLQQL